MCKQLTIIFLYLFLVSCHDKNTKTDKNFQIAFMADVHLQDIYGAFSDSDYKGVLNPETNKHTIARTMQSQLQSTRLFNENYIAFLAALDDVVSRNIKYVVLPGDFSDDGQLLNVKGLKRILNEYSVKHNMQFVLTTGNHDPVRPFYQDGGKYDFIGKEGMQQPIFSSHRAYNKSEIKELKPIITKDIAKLGYKQILAELKDFGFFPKKNDLYWESPFSNYAYSNYNYNTALIQAELSNRKYQIQTFGDFIPDVSYLVEPTEGLWFLAIDANVYVPKDAVKNGAEDPNNYNGASEGYNNVLTYKKYLLQWIKTVTERAKKLNKTLIVFSHYPVIDFNDDASKEIEVLFGKNKFQLHRVPEETIADAFINAGVTVHFGGHMHINDTGVRNNENGHLVNVQIPSLAAYIPAYKVVTIKDGNFQIETVVVDSVPRFNELFPLYKQEYDYLQKTKNKPCWDKSILSSKSYLEFTENHLKQLVRIRYLAEEWKPEFRDFMLNSSGKDFHKFASTIQSSSNDSYGNWDGFDMIFDFYRLRSADELVMTNLEPERMASYKAIISNYLIKYTTIDNPNSLENDFYQFCLIFKKFLNGAPSKNFNINFKEGTIEK